MTADNPSELGQLDRSKPPLLPRREVWLIIAGFPALYLLNSFTPWSMGLFRDGDRSWSLPFFASIVLLHWVSIFAVVAVMRRHGHDLRKIGFGMSPASVIVFFVIMIAIGVALVGFRRTWPLYHGPVEPWMMLYPVTLADKIAWIGIALTAGFCEEFVYRGFAIRALQGRGWRSWQAVALASVSFALLHGIAGIILFPVYVAFALVYSGLFLWSKRLAPVMYLHALFDLTAILAV